MLTSTLARRPAPVGHFILRLIVAVAMTAPAVAALGDTDSTVAVPDSGRSAWDRRFRLVGGGALVIGYLNDGLAFPFANADYRWSSNVSRPPGATTLGAGFEIGTNLIFPYLKAGPEVRLGNAFVAAHAGMTFAFFVGGHDASAGILPFVGAAGGYCFALEGVGLELESGINTASYGDEGGAVSYLALALAFR